MLSLNFIYCTVNCRYLLFAYLEVKIWSLFKHENLTTGNKILWKRGEVKLHIQLWLFDLFFHQFCKN